MTETMSTEDAARLLGCSAKWLAEQCARRRVPHSIIARRIRFTDEHIEAIIRLFEVPMADIPAALAEDKGESERLARVRRRSPARAFPDPDVRPPT